MIKLLVLLSLLSSCRSLSTMNMYKGLWLGELENVSIPDHQILEVKDKQIYFYNIDRLVDSTHIIKGDQIRSSSKSVLAKVNLLEDKELLQVNTIAGDDTNTVNLRRIKPTLLSCDSLLLDRIGNDAGDWHLIITEEGALYCTDSINAVADLSIYEYAKIDFLKIDHTYFLVTKNSNGKSTLSPILTLADHEFEVYNAIDDFVMSINWGIP